MKMFRKILLKVYRTILFNRTELPVAGDMYSIIFSPHPDDETLGCGGTIARKVKAGESVLIVLMTDGSCSHKGLIPEDELRNIRYDEFYSSLNILGVLKENIILLDYKDGELSKYREQAIDVISEILIDKQPGEIFIPYKGEQPEDHYVTNEIVYSALNKTRIKCNIYEYPIWYWMQWPFCKIKFRGFKGLLRLILNTIKSNSNLLLKFQARSNVKDLLEIKKQALLQYKSQMTKYIDNDKWSTLRDVSDGDFIDCFQQNTEVFHHAKM